MKLMMAYWFNLQGQNELHPVKRVLTECWEHNETNYTSFGWISNAKAINIGLHQLQYSNTVCISSIPPWLFPLPNVDLNIQFPTWFIVQKYFKKHYPESVFLFTDGSKDPETGFTGAPVYIPMSDCCIKKRVTNHLSVYATELLALHWIEEKKMKNTVIASDSYSSLESIRSGRSLVRMDIINEIFRKI